MTQIMQNKTIALANIIYSAQIVFDFDLGKKIVVVVQNVTIYLNTCRHKNIKRQRRWNFNVQNP